MLFGSTFVTVLLLVVQSANNIHGHRRPAALTSLGIGISQLVLWRYMPNAAAAASYTEMAAFLAGGPLGNLAAQWLKRHDIARIRKLHND